MNNLKLYIAVLDEVPDHMVPVLVAHAILQAHVCMWNGPGLYNEWYCNSFKKVVLRVNDKEFKKLKELPSHTLAHENTVLNGEKSCIVLEPRHTWPNVIKFAKMWKPSLVSNY